MLYYSITEKYAIINILSFIMEADTIIHPKEIAFMNKVMGEMEINVVDLDHMEIKDLTLEKQVILQMSKEKQQEVKKLFIRMAEIDGYVDPREIDIINFVLQK